MATPYLELTELQGSDYINYNVLNDNFKTIDAALHDYVEAFSNTSDGWVFEKWHSGRFRATMKVSMTYTTTRENWFKWSLPFTPKYVSFATVEVGSGGWQGFQCYVNSVSGATVNVVGWGKDNSTATVEGYLVVEGTWK